MTKSSFWNCFKLEKEKRGIVSSSSKCKKGEKRRGRCSGVAEFILERTSDFSLKYRAIRPSAVFGTRRKAAPRRAGYAWKPDLRSFDKLREVAVSPYLGFTLYLSVLQYFG